jgi:predicted pyridoxine 5'-phosphate oxidase superfamily flavin-nucleotide-binding protein
MVKMPLEVRETLSKQKPVPIATSSKDGVPNVIFVGLMKILDDETLMVVDNFFKKTADNLSANPRISVICYDPQTKKSYQIKGRTRICKEGQTYDEMKSWVKGINDKLPARSCVIIKVEEIYNALWGPGAGDRIA